MKLIYQVRSPFLFIALLLCIISCTSKSTTTLSYSNVKNIENAINAQNTAEKFDSLNIYDSAFRFYSKAATLFKEEKDSLRTAYPMLRMAKIQSSQNDYTGAETTAIEALPYVKASGNKSYLRETYNVLGTCYKLSNYEKSIDNYKKAMGLTNDLSSNIIISYNIGNVYKEQGHYQRALNIYFKLLKKDTLNTKDLIDDKARILNNVGETYNALNNPIALQYLEKAVEIRVRIEDRKGLSSTYNQMAIYWKTKNPNLSLIYANKALELARKFKDTENQLLSLKTLINVIPIEKIRNLSKVSEELRDSIASAELKKGSRFAQMKYESKEMQDILREQRILSNKNLVKFQIILLITIFVIISASLLYIMRGLKHKKEKLEQVYVTETRMSKKIHDELANDMFNAMTFAETQDFSIPEQQQKLVQNLDSIYTKTRDISRENNTIDTGENYGIILTEMLADYKTETVNVMVVNFETVNWDKMAAHKKITVYRILQELMVNMKKHSQASRVAIKFDKGDKKITIQYTDNGCGLSNEKLIYKNGLQNAETRILSVGGNITFDSEPNKGLKAIIVVPV